MDIGLNEKNYIEKILRLFHQNKKERGLILT